jgi:broad specificity phosphatase PhoE
MAKTLILVRHGHRDTARRELDNGLSDKGREQARAIRRFFTDRFKPDDFKRGLWLVSSPKVRCVETLQPLAKEINRPVDIHPALDEQGSKESAKAFLDRVHGFLQEWEQSPSELTVLASHGDWLPVAIGHLLGLPQEVKKGSWLELEKVDGGAALRWYIPSFKHFYR